MQHLLGREFGNLKVVNDAGTKDNRRMWLCACSCGNMAVVSSNHLLTGNTKGCGCMRNRDKKGVLLKQCRRGHKLSGDNLYVTPKGFRLCAACGKHRKYKLTKEAFESKLLAQKNKCACCDDEFTTENKPCVDHDHVCCSSKHTTCGKCVRGLLCRGCNNGLGFLKDSSVRAAKAVAYLRKWGK